MWSWNKDGAQACSEWEQAKTRRNALTHEAFFLQAMIERLADAKAFGPAKDAVQARIAALTTPDPDTTACMSTTQATARALWGLVVKGSPDFPHAVLVHGAVTTVEHSWFVLELDEKQAMDPRWRIIVDPCCPDVTPSCLVIAPNSPLQLAYREFKRET